MMAINYAIYSDLKSTDLSERLTQVREYNDDVWETASVSDDLGPFHDEVMQEYGVGHGFKSYVFFRHNKLRSVEARQKTMDFFLSLPGRKLILQGDVFVAYKDDD